jgi:hypothetical protein
MDNTDASGELITHHSGGKNGITQCKEHLGDLVSIDDIN